MRGNKAWAWVKEVVKKFMGDRCTMDALALSYVTILSLVPLIVVTFSLLSSFATLAAVKERLLSYLLQFLVPGSASAVVEYITGFSTKAKALGLGGLLALFSLAFSLFSSAEQSMSRIWRVKRSRTFVNKLFVFSNILFWVPLLLGASFYLSTKVALVPYLGGFSRLYFILLPLLISWLAFSFFFLIVPPYRVSILAAVSGGSVAAVLWELAKNGFDIFVAHAFSIKAFSVIYGSLVIFPVFLIWIYLCWVITLLGAEVSFMVHYRGTCENGRPCIAGFFMSVTLLTRLTKGFLQGRGPVSEREVVSGLGLDVARGVLKVLEDEGFIVEAENGYILVKPPERVFLRELVGLFVPQDIGQGEVKGLISKIEGSLGEVSIMDLAKEDTTPLTPTS